MEFAQTAPGGQCFVLEHLAGPNQLRRDEHGAPVTIQKLLSVVQASGLMMYAFCHI